MSPAETVRSRKLRAFCSAKCRDSRRYMTKDGPMTFRVRSFGAIWGRVKSPNVRESIAAWRSVRTSRVNADQCRGCGVPMFSASRARVEVGA